MKVVVIGGGIVGASAALHLTDAGVDVVVVDDDRPGRATRAGAGIVSAPGRRQGPGHPAFELARLAFAAYPALVARLGGGDGPAGLWDVIGELHVAPPGPELDAVHAQLLERNPAGRAERLDPARTLAAYPYLRPELASVRIVTTACVDGEVVRTALLQAAVSAGARLLTGPATVDIHAGRAVGATVGGVHEPADEVIVAAGAWSADLVRPAGLDLAVGAQRGQIIHLALPGVDTSRLPVVHPVGADHYLLPFADSRIVIGATRETGSGFDPRLTAGGVAQVLTDALDVAPGLAGATVADMRVGLRPVTPDGDPLIGPASGCEGLWIATGMGPVGLSVGPYCGALIAGAVVGEKPELDLAPFLPDRTFAG